MMLWRMAPHKIDPRSAATFRILLALFVLGDIAGRLLLGRIDLAWYTSLGGNDDVSVPSIVDPNDTPHRAPLHRFWFYRGSEQLQITLFLLTCISAILFGLGWKYCYRMNAILLWLLVTAMQSRAPILNDGSDRYLRCILLWAIFVPLDKIWTVDSVLIQTRRKQKVETAHTDDLVDESEDIQNSPDFENPTSSGLRRRRKHQVAETSSQLYNTDAERDHQKETVRPTHHSMEPIASAATLGLTLQIVFMYIGTVLNRLPGSKWFYPELTAVHYAMSSTFAVREWAANMIRAFPGLSKIMTAKAMIIETGGPLLCFMAPYGDGGENNRSWRHIPAMIVMSLHFGLWLGMRLPQWQLLAIICNVVWIPPYVWDSILFRANKEKANSVPTTTTTKTQVSNAIKTSLGSTLSRIVHKGFSWFFLLYMIYNFAGEQMWIPKHDNGDIGEAIQFSQYFKMYGPDPPETCHSVVITGRLSSKDNKEVENNDEDAGTARIDVLRALKTGDWGTSSEIDEGEYAFMKEGNPPNMGSQFVSWRWENAIHKYAKEKDSKRHRPQRLANFLCVIGNNRRNSDNESAITHVEVAFRKLKINPIGAKQRFTDVPSLAKPFEADCTKAGSRL